MAEPYPFELVSFCEKLSGAVSSAGRENGWRLNPFGRQGFNTDVGAGGVVLKITTGGTPGPDGSGAVIKLDRGAHRVFNVRKGADGLELVDGGGQVVSPERFIELVGEACDAPVKSAQELPTPLLRYLADLALAITTAGQANGWTLSGFGSRGYNTDVIVGSTILKITTEGTPAKDGSGAQIKLKKSGWEEVFTSKAAGTSVTLADSSGQAADFDRIVELVADAVGTPIQKEVALSPELIRFFEKMRGLVVKMGQDESWEVTLFGSRGLGADCAVGPTLVKVTSDINPNGKEATIWIKGPNHKFSFGTKMGALSELELTENGAPIPDNRFAKLLAEACGTPIEDEAPLPQPLVRLLEQMGSALGSAGNENGWGVKLFGKRGLNADVAQGALICKVTTVGKPAADGTGVTLRLHRAGFEKNLTVRPAKDGNLELADNGQTVDVTRFIELVGQGVGVELKKADDLPAPLNRFYEKLASTVTTAGNDTGWKVQQFGSRGFNADMSMGPNVVKISTEGTPGPDGGGIEVKIKRAGFEKSYTTRLGKQSELELVDKSGGVLPMEDFVDVIKEACKV
jgi:hypothetical protein